LAWSAAGLILLSSWAVAALLIAAEREKSQEAAALLTRSISGVLADNTSRVVGVVDRALIAMRDFVESQPLESRELRPIPPIWMSELDPVADMIWQVSTANASGRIYLSTSHLRIGADLSGRDYFILARRLESDELVVSEPFLSDITGVVSVAFARRVRSRDGSFEGIVQAVVASDVLSHVYRSTGLGAAASIALLRFDGTKIAEAPDAGRDVRRNLRASAAVQGVPVGEASVVRDRDEEGRPRTTAYRAVPGRPLIVRVSLIDSESVLTNPTRIQTPYVAATVLTVIVLFGLVVVLAYQRRLAQADADRLRELSERQMLLDAALDNMNQGLLMVDVTGNVVVINEKAVELLGLPPQFTKPPFVGEELFRWQLNSAEFEGGHSNINNAIAARMNGYQGQGKCIAPVPEYQRVRPNGTVLNVRTTPLSGGGFVRTFTDVTELHRYAQDLERFAYVASHDLQEPLRKITTHTRLLGTAIADGDGPEVERCRVVLEASARRGRTIVSDLLNYAQLRDKTVQRVEIQLADLLGPIIARKRECAPDARISIALADVAVRCDAGLVTQVFENLIDNALKYRFLGQPADLHIESVVDPIDGTVRIAVRDRGIGFDRAHADEIFQPFKRLVSRSEYKGTGIGLSIVRSIVEKHGWTVSADSVRGEGSTFTVAIPATDVVTASAAAA